MSVTTKRRFLLLCMIAGEAGCSSSDSPGIGTVDALPAIDAAGSRPDGPPAVQLDAAVGDAPSSDPVLSSLKLETGGPVFATLNGSNLPVIAGWLDRATNVGGITVTKMVDPAGVGGPDIVAAQLNAASVGVWAQRFGDDQDQSANAVAVNQDGVTLVTGSFSGTLSYRSGMPPLTTAAEVAFVMALDASGNAIWAKTLDLGVGGNAFSVAVDPTDGGFVLTGYATGPVVFDSFTGTYGGGGNEDIFVAKVKGNATGDLVWARQIGGADAEIARAVTVAANGNVFLVGNYRGALDFGMGALPTPGTGRQNLFVAKLDGAGQAVDSVAFAQSGSGRPLITSVTTDSAGGIIIGGNFSGKIVFDAAASIELTPAGGDGFVAKLAPDLHHAAWARRIGDPMPTVAPLAQGVNGVAVDGQGNVVAVGLFFGTTDFGLASPITPPDSNTDAFALKLDGASGTPRWVRTTKGIGAEVALSVAVARDDGSVWVTGTFLASPTPTPPIANWGSSPGTELIFSLDPVQGAHSYLVHLAP